jgi:TonB family protein
MGARPQVNDDSDESGRIVFEITVDDTGDIINVRVKESTVSQSIVDLYKRAVSRMKLVPKSENVPSTSKGTITFNIKSR